MKLHIIIIDN